MANPTPAQDVSAIIGTNVNENWPGTTPATGYYDLTKLTPTTPASLPSPTDWLLYFTITTILASAPQDFTFNRTQTDNERYALYGDIIERLSANRTNLNNLITALTTIYNGLPHT